VIGALGALIAVFLTWLLNSWRPVSSAGAGTQAYRIEKLQLIELEIKQILDGLSKEHIPPTQILIVAIEANLRIFDSGNRKFAKSALRELRNGHKDGVKDRMRHAALSVMNCVNGQKTLIRSE
jgi:hypothetical protein